MIAAVGLAMGALSSVSSLVEQAASNVSSALDPPAPEQSFTPSPAAPKKAGLRSVPNTAGPPIPKFDKRAHAALLSAQEHLQHRRNV